LCIALRYTALRHDLIEAQVAAARLGTHRRKLFAGYLESCPTPETPAGAWWPEAGSRPLSRRSTEQVRSQEVRMCKGCARTVPEFDITPLPGRCAKSQLECPIPAATFGVFHAGDAGSPGLCQSEASQSCSAGGR
jgi:hypothetical protein